MKIILKPPIPTQHPRDILTVPMSMLLSLWPTVRNLAPIFLNVFTCLQNPKKLSTYFQNSYPLPLRKAHILKLE